MRKIGVTGTRSGMTTKQFAMVHLQMIQLKKEFGNENLELHHGDCVGVDAQVAKIAKAFGWKIVCHPPIKEDMQAHFPSDEYREKKSYFARNRNIVDETELLLVVPYQNSHQNNGGTWYTHDYAVKKNKPVVVFYPGEGRE